MPASAPTVEGGATSAKGLRRLGVGAGLGLAAGIVAVVLPVLFVYLSTYAPGGFFRLNASLLDTSSILVLAGAILYILSLFLYRRSFSALRQVDRRFAVASVLCIVGSVGFLLLLVAAAVLLGSTNALLSCVHGEPSHALSCVQSGTPLGAYTGLAGFWLGWLGGVGIVMGLLLAGGRFRQGAITAGGVAYALLLVVLVGPFVTIFRPVPGLEYLLVAAPVLVVLGPALVFGGSRLVHDPGAAAAPPRSGAGAP